MREKDFGIWHEYTWDRPWELVIEAAHGLLALGVEPGDRVSIHSEDRPEWVILDLATVAVRGITVGLYPTNPAAEVEYLLGDCGACVHLAEDQEQFDKVLAVDRADVPDLRTILFVEPRGCRRRRRSPPAVLGRLPRARAGPHRDAYPRRGRRADGRGRADDVMTLVYTSGTTGPPKGAMLTNANAAFCIDKIVDSERPLPRRAARARRP